MEINNVTSEEFNRTRVIGKPYAEVASDSTIEWQSCYPLVDSESVVVDIVDGNYPGDWDVIDDLYAVAN